MKSRTYGGMAVKQARTQDALVVNQVYARFTESSPSFYRMKIFYIRGEAAPVSKV